MLRYKTETRLGLVALYDIRPGNRAGQFLQPRSPHGATGAITRAICSGQNVTTSKPITSFLQAGCPSCHPTNSVKGKKKTLIHLFTDSHRLIYEPCKQASRAAYVHASFTSINSSHIIFLFYQLFHFYKARQKSQAVAHQRHECRIILGSSNHSKSINLARPSRCTTNHILANAESLHGNR